MDLALVFIGLGPVILSLVVLYGVPFGDHPAVLRMRRAVMNQETWRFRFEFVGHPLAGFLPFGLGLLLAGLCRSLAGHTLSVRIPPTDAIEGLVLVAIALMVAGIAFMIRPPGRILPAWYRDIVERQRRMSPFIVAAVEDLRADLGTLAADLGAAMTIVSDVRANRTHVSALTAVDAASRVVAETAALDGRLSDPLLNELVAEWKAIFDRTPKGPALNPVTGAAMGATDAEWRQLEEAATAAMDHVHRLTAGLRTAEPTSSMG